MEKIERIGGLSELAGEYDGILCDVWGVLHNGVAAWPGAVDALSRYRRAGRPVVMITNAPRPHPPVLTQLASLGVPQGVFDAVVTSGDVTRKLIGEMPGAVLHIGPERDRIIFEDLDVRLVGLEDAGSVVCTGLNDDRTESPEDYRAVLADIRARNLPFICANPDIVVEFGDRLLWCAGALARDYRALGGETHIVGKPHRPIYELAIGKLAGLRGGDIDRSRILAIGDGIATDIEGASRAGVDSLYISAGIHASDYGHAESPDSDALAAFLRTHDARPRGWMPRLAW